MLKMAHHWTQTAERLERAADPYWAKTNSTSVKDSSAATQQPEYSKSGEK